MHNTNTNNCPDLFNPTFRHLGFFRDINKQVYDVAHRKTQCVTARHEKLAEKIQCDRGLKKSHVNVNVAIKRILEV